MLQNLPTIRINKRAKRIILKRDPQRGFILVISGKSLLHRAMQLWQDFLKTQPSQRPLPQLTQKKIAIGSTISLIGEDFLIIQNGKQLRKVEMHPPKHSGENGRITICASVKNPEKALKNFIYHFAQQVILEKSAYFAEKAQVSFQKIAIKDMRSRWGSCSKSGNLSYSWRIIMAPESVVDYLCAHEVAHLKHFDHSKAFWALVEDICPGSKPKRQWLKTHGHGLMCYHFG